MRVRSRGPASASVALLLALMVLAGVQSIAAHVAVTWRSAVVSFDSPVTQVADEAASQTLAAEDPGRFYREQATGTSRVSGRARADATDARPSIPALRSRLTRSPPAA